MTTSPLMDLPTQQADLNHLFSPSFYTIFPAQPKIPKRPLYRSMKIDYERRLQQIHVKAWKALKCGIFGIVNNYSTIGCVIHYLEKKEASTYLCSPTFRKCLKPVKNLTLWQTELDMKFSVHKLRPEKLALSQRLEIEKTKDLFKRVVNLNNLKHLMVDNQDNTPGYYWKLLSFFPRIRSLYHFRDDFWRFEDSLKDSRKRIRFPRLKALCLNEEKGLKLSDFSVLPWFKQLQHLSFTSSKSPKELIISQLKQLNQLRSLRLNLPDEYGDPKTMEFDFQIFADFNRIELLHIDLGSGFVEKSWNTILQLSSLEDFAFSCHSHKQPLLPSQEVLSSYLYLKKLKISLRISSESIHLYHAIFSRIQVSETLELESTPIGLSMFFAKAFSHPLRSLKLGVFWTKDGSGSLAKDVAEFLNQQSALKSLSIEVAQPQCDVLNALCKAAEKLSSLESLEFSLPRWERIEKVEFESLRAMIVKHRQALRTLKLDLQNLRLTSIELSWLVSTLKSLKCLTNLSLSLDLSCVFEAALCKFKSFVSSAKQMKSLQVDVSCSRDWKIQIWRAMQNQKSLLTVYYTWKGSIKEM